MKITNTSNYRQKIEGVWIEPGETEEVDSDISEDELSKYFTLEDEPTSTTESTEEVEDVEDGSEDEDDEEEVSKSEEKQDNKGD